MPDQRTQIPFLVIALLLKLLLLLMPLLLLLAVIIIIISIKLNFYLLTFERNSCCNLQITPTIMSAQNTQNSNNSTTTAAIATPSIATHRHATHLPLAPTPYSPVQSVQCHTGHMSQHQFHIRLSSPKTNITFRDVSLNQRGDAC